MGTTQSSRRFRVNPVEVAIFSIIMLVFANSVYNLIYDQHGFHPAALTQVAANPLASGDRAPAFATPAFANLEMKCEDTAPLDTQASKIRLTGPLCGLGATPPAEKGASEKTAAPDTTKLSRTSLVNTTNKFSATVFTDAATGKFSTDYIPLIAGKNTLHVEFTYASGKTVAQDITVQKN